jgi:CRP/FNR family transcriptional regulator, cyclic AMP receptor protein
MQWELLRGLPDDEREAVLGAMRTRRFRRGDVVFHEGDAGDSVHFVAEGHAAVRVTTPGGETATLSVLGPGQAFGELALLRRSSQRTASVVAVEPLETRVLHRDVFFRLVEEHPSVERLLVGLLAARVDRLSRHLVEALHLPVEQRLVRRLLETARLYEAEADGVVLPLTQEDVAQLAGTTRPTASTVLNELQDAGLLELTRGKVLLRDLAGLGRRAT